nr:MAG TPA: hypothetical protein [Caudoviricetes sp.]
MILGSLLHLQADLKMFIDWKISQELKVKGYTFQMQLL